MSRKISELHIDEAWETRVESSYTKSCIRIMTNNREYTLMEIDAECQIPGCDGTKCGQSRTTIAKIRKEHRGNSILKRKTKERLLNEMPTQGKRAKKGPIFEVVKQDGEFDDDDDEEEFQKFLKIQWEEKEIKKNAEMLAKRERYIRLHRMWIKILEYYTKHLNPREVTRIAERLYFQRCEDFDARQLERLENRAINILHSYIPMKTPNPRRMPKEILKISLIDKKRWIDPQKVKRKHDFYGTINEEISDEKKFNYLYNKARELGANQTKELENQNTTL